MPDALKVRHVGEADGNLTTSEITVTGIRYWADKPGQLAQLLVTSSVSTVQDPSGQPVQPNEIVVLTCPKQWAENPLELRDALAVAIGRSTTPTIESTVAPGAVAPMEDRLVFTVEEAAELLGISRSFAYEAVQRGEIPSMRIGKRILVPKAALVRFLDAVGNGGRSDET